MPQAHSLRQLFACEREACRVATCIRGLAQLIEKSERLEYGGIDAHSDGRISLFDALKSWPAGKGAFSDNPGGEPATSSRVAQIVPKLAQGSANAYGRSMRGRHKCNLGIP